MGNQIENLIPSRLKHITLLSHQTNFFPSPIRSETFRYLTTLTKSWYNKEVYDVAEYENKQ